MVPLPPAGAILVPQSCPGLLQDLSQGQPDVGLEAGQVLLHGALRFASSLLCGAQAKAKEAKEAKEATASRLKMPGFSKGQATNCKTRASELRS